MKRDNKTYTVYFDNYAKYISYLNNCKKSEKIVKLFYSFDRFVTNKGYIDITLK